MAKGKYEYWKTDDGLMQIAAWARDGLIDEQIAANIGITRGTLYEWKKKYPDISDALKKNKNIADIEVENALYKRALGYRYEETTIEIHKVEKSVKKTRKEMPPDVLACFFWLKNRKSDTWRDKQEIEIKGDISISAAIKKARERAERSGD